MLRTTAFVLLSCSLAAPVDAQPRRDRGAPPELEHCTYAEKSFDSEALGRSLEYGIYLPKGYDDKANATKRYPLIVWLHGMFEDHNRFHYRGGAAVLDAVLGKGELPPCVFVTANGNRNSFYVNAKGGDRWEDAIARDLVEHVTETYRVATERDRRALMGVSMGGYGALKIALKHPDRFGVVAAHSAALLPRDHSKLDERFPWLQRWGGAQRAIGQMFGDPIDGEMWAAENVFGIVSKLDADGLDGLKVYFDCGDEDRYGFQGPNTELHELLEKKKIKHTWQLVEGGNHGWNTRRSETSYNRTQLPVSLRFVAAAWASRRAAAGLKGLLPGAGRGGADK